LPEVERSKFPGIFKDIFKVPEGYIEGQKVKKLDFVKLINYINYQEENK